MSTPKKLSEEEIRKTLETLPGWERVGVPIAKEYEFKDFAQAMVFVNEVARLAEEADHHPDILVRYNKVRLTLSTHSAGGLTAKDEALARKIEAAAPGSGSL